MWVSASSAAAVISFGMLAQDTGGAAHAMRLVLTALTMAQGEQQCYKGSRPHIAEQLHYTGTSYCHEFWSGCGTLELQQMFKQNDAGMQTVCKAI